MLVLRKISELRVSELRTELEKRNLDSKGLKSALLQRLQKAIIDEGGDIDQIEVDVSASASPINKKNSPRIKRMVERPLENEMVPDLAAVEKRYNETVSEKSDLASDDGGGGVKVEEASFHMGDALERGQEEQREEMQAEECLSGGTDTQDENEPALQRGNENNSALDYNEDHNKKEFALREENAKESASEAEFVDRNNVQPEQQRDDFTADTIIQGFSLNEEANYPQVSDHAEGSLQTEETTQVEEENATIDDQYEDDADSEEMRKRDGSDMPLEDDVLDMLDYDIEMPEHAAQGDNTDEKDVQKDDGEATNEGVMADVTKESDESGKKDSNLASESSTSEVPSSDEKKPLKNLWISGLSSSTRASELKAAFSRYGKVVGAKVVANARSPSSKCYGFIAMATPAAAEKCIVHLHNTEMHGRLITVEFIKHDPSTRRTPRKRPENREEPDDKASQDSTSKEGASLRRSVGENSKEPLGEGSAEKRTASESGGKIRIGEKRFQRSPLADRPRLIRRPAERRESSAEPNRKRPRPIGERKVMIDNNKKGGMSLRVNVRSAHEGRRPNMMRRLSPSPLRTVRGGPRIDERVPRRIEGRPIDSGRMRERDPFRPRDARDDIARRKAATGETARQSRSLALQASIERDRLLLRKEREERNFLRLERERLERERRQLERDRIERERLEHERIKLEQERKRELEKIQREKEEMKRLQEINRYEQSQRQRALKRMYDDRPEGKRVDRDDRRRYEGESRDRSGGPVDLYYREDEGGYRSRAGNRLDSRSDKMNFHDVDHRNMNHSNDTDARYGPSSTGGRRVEKYERPGLKGSADYGPDRRSGGNVGGMSFRHHDKDVTDDRKVVPRERGRPSSSSFRRDDVSMSKKEAVSPMRSGSGRSRANDRDLREEIRQGPMSAGARKGTPPHRGDLRHRENPPPGRSAPRGGAEPPKYQERAHPEPPSHNNIPIQTGPPGGKPIPTTGKSGMGFQPSTAWPGWQHDERGDTNAVWRGPGVVPVGGAPVGRLPTMPMPFNPLAAVNAPQPMGGDNAMMAHNLQPSFPPSRMENFKPVRRF